jgi:serine phosphatase RsbU (regulator of sigma subunit)
MPMRAKILLFGILLPIMTVAVLFAITSLTFYSEKDNSFRIQGYNLATQFSSQYQDGVTRLNNLMQSLKASPNSNQIIMEQSRAYKDAFILIQKTDSGTNNINWRAYWSSDPTLKINGKVFAEKQGNQNFIFQLKTDYEEVYFVGAELNQNIFIAIENKGLSDFINKKKLWSLYLFNSNFSSKTQTPLTQGFASNVSANDNLLTSISAEDAKKISSVQSGAVSFNSSSNFGNIILSVVGLPGISTIWVTTLGSQMLRRSLSVIAFRGIMGSLSFIFFVLFIVYKYADRVTEDLRELISGVNRVAQGRFDLAVNVHSSDEIGALGKFFNEMMSKITYLMSEAAEKARMESELYTARTVQETLFPSSSLTEGQIKISGKIIPATECGGDWWYHFELNDKVWLWLGDATGHGVPAALLTSAARAVSSVVQRSLLSLTSGNSISPTQAMGMLNSAIYDVSKGKLMMTFFLAVMDRQTGQMISINASHEPAMILPIMTTKPRMSDFKTIENSQNPRLGQHAQFEFKENQHQLVTGDRLILYTDGVFDIENAEKKPLGERNFFSLLGSSLFENQDVEKATQAMIHNLDKYRLETPLKDDVTLVVCKYEG